ncbi:SDR family NAD(P)-dependent oxidoreductase [Cohnella candidum]|uniref:SDR family oxidoreductase n=1 Tax=Cohnella candidum TaxID=2674991 RepID=A0A3G3JWC5_9BACL|nr:SDR family oxidoreductase [Cohnella candidum]AYQ72553.1 SDR family oxidoreductase [Cohnella candidum]
MFEGLTVVITGAAGGIGRHLCRAYAAKGANVYATSLHGVEGEELAEEVRLAGGRIRYRQADLRDAAAVPALFEEAEAECGGIDILINNAGYGVWKSPLELTVEEWDGVLNTNLRGTFLCSREAAIRMKEQGRKGAIVNIASTRHLQSEPHSEAYAASKGGIASLTHALALSLGEYGIRVNAISPGWIETGDYDALRPEDHTQHPAGRVGKPDDIVRACFYLTDPENDFVTGIDLVVDGGMTRKMIYVP